MADDPEEPDVTGAERQGPNEAMHAQTHEDDLLLLTAGLALLPVIFRRPRASRSRSNS
jgi:hypothetical protein